jgi:two-component system sensor histidine kinase GlrK
LSDVSTRLVRSQARRSEAIALLDATAAKFAVTHDAGYLRKIAQLRADFSRELRQAAALALSHDERAALAALNEAWAEFGRVADGFVATEGPVTATPAALASFRNALVNLRARADLDGIASREAMRQRVAAAESEGDRAVEVAWFALALSLVVAVVTAVVLRRSITGPLHVLSTGTREVARGKFGHRLELPGSGEFAQVARAFNAMIVRLDKADRMKQDFVSTVSHDLKSPLASLRETTSLLLDEVPGPLSDSQRRVLLLQRESTERLGRMIAKLLELSRLEAGVSRRLRPIDARPLLAGALAQAAVVGLDRGVGVRCTGHLTGEIWIAGDEDALRQLLDNLLENAIKFSPRDTVVELGTDTAGGRLLLTVADRGPGVEPEHARRIFERFFQTAAGRAVAGRGAGLGLAICLEVVRAHQGRIHVEPRTGGGSVFVVNLPMLEVAAPRRARFAPPTAAGAGT